GIVRPADAREPGGPTTQYRRRDRDRFDVVHGRRAAVEPGAGRERRLKPRHTLLALEALEQRGLLAADIRAGSAMDMDLELPARAASIVADQAGLARLADRFDQVLRLVVELAADVDVGGVRAHGEARDQTALDQQMRVVAQDVAIFAGARLRFVGVDDDI